MTTQPTEVTEIHTRMLKTTLELGDTRAYVRRIEPAGVPPSAERAFIEYWFGARSLPRVKVLLSDFRLRFHAYPEALAVLHGWRDMPAEVLPLICHWHVQLADPLYRRFTGAYLVARRDRDPAQVTRDLVASWVEAEQPQRWTIATRVQLASKLLSAAHDAGLLESKRDPRPLSLPRVPDDALTYLLYLLRGITMTGTLLENPYLASVGLSGPDLDNRLRKLPALHFQRMGGLVDFGWHYPSLLAWAEACVLPPHEPAEPARHASEELSA